MLRCLVAAALLAGAASLEAQDRDSSQSLEDLIPDTAIDNPETWATAQNTPDTGDTPEPDFDAPFVDYTSPPMDWPDEAGLPPMETVEPDAEVDFAGLDEELGDPFADTVSVRLSDSLEIALPSDPALFPIRAQFLDAFRSLSVVEELGGSEDNIALVAARARADQDLLGTLLRAFGYYDAQVVRAVAAPDAQGEARNVKEAVLRFAIVPGPRYAFGTIALGDLASAPDHEALRSAFAIQPGDPVSSYAIVEGQYNLDTALGEQGYPFAEIDAPELLIDHARDEADLTMAVRPNGKYVFGEVTSSLPDFLPGRHFATIARFEPGDTYRRSLELDLRRAIIATGLVSSAQVKPREVTPPAGDQPGVVALDVAITKAPLRTIAGALGYGTEDGLRVEGSWEHRNFFPPEGAVKVRAIVGTREQLGGVSFKRNNIWRRDQLLSVDAYARNVRTDAVEARTVAVATSFARLSNLLFQKPFSWALGAEVLYSDERNRVIGGVARPRQTYLIGSISGRATIDASDSLLDPRRGYRLTAFLAPEVSRSVGSDTFYLRGQFDATWYQPVTGSAVIAGRVRAATIQGAETFEVAPSRRLYAGGSNSVRGYGYQAVGPRNDFGEPTGGRSLVEFSLEARIGTGLFDGAVELVPFFDAGSVSIEDVPDFRFVKYGAGLGLRYKTDFGPIRVDLGFPLNRDPMFDSPVAVYVSLGQAF